MALGEPLKGCKLSYKLSFLFLGSSLVTTDVCLPVVCIVLDIVVPCVELALIASLPCGWTMGGSTMCVLLLLLLFSGKVIVQLLTHCGLESLPTVSVILCALVWV